jgi:small-conductance mechanosensitive channel
MPYTVCYMDGTLKRIAHKTGASLHHLGDWLSLHGVDILIILIIAWILRRISKKIITGLLKQTIRSDMFPTKGAREKRLKTLSSLTNAIVQVVISGMAMILILGIVFPNIATGLFASAGLLTVALGFGAKDLINDLVTGIFIISEGQYRVGDSVEIAGVSGVVEAVTVRTTVLRDLDGNVHYVPNGDIVVATNKTLGFSRINENIAFDPKTDIDRLTHVINHVGEEMATALEFKNKIKEAPHVTQIVGYGPTGLIIKVSATTGESDKFAIKSDMYRRLHQAFTKNNIKIALQPVPIAPPSKK